jgi:transcriptional regulator with XRE-family HTH domain
MVARYQAGPFGLLLQRHRTAAGLSQEELAERAGLSRRGLSDLERGARRAPYPATVRRLAEALGLAEADRAALLMATHTYWCGTSSPPPALP